MAARAKKPALVAAVPAVAKRKPRKKAVAIEDQFFKFADGVKVTVQWPEDAMPEWLPRFNLMIMAAGAAKGGDAGMVGVPQMVPAFNGRPQVPAEESRHNLPSMAGYNMTAGTMDPKEALKGIPGLTETQKAVMRTLDAVESSVDESQLGDIADDEELSPEEIGLPPPS